jgi:exodeoxyribonuclease VII small subunit
MKSKNIPADIKSKSIKEAQNEIKEIINNLENTDTNLEESVSKYNRMIQLNSHIQDEFKRKLSKIRDSKYNNKEDSSNKD